VRRILTYVLVYLLWLVTAALGVLSAVWVHGTLQLALVTTSWHRYSLNAVDKFSMFFLGLLLLGMFIFSEYYYRTGARKGKLLSRFGLFTAVELGILLVMYGIRLVLVKRL